MSESSSNKRLWTILTPIIITVITAVINKSKIVDFLFPGDKVNYKVMGSLTNAGKYLSQVDVNLNGGDLKENKISKTDSKGEYVFSRLESGMYTCAFKYKGRPYSLNYSCDDAGKPSIKKELDISNILESDKPALSEEEKKEIIKEEAAELVESAVEVKKVNKVQEVVKAKITAPIAKLSANEILDRLELYVEIESVKGSNYSHYHYYVESEDNSILDEIDVVYYQRNHSTFPEKANNQYHSSNDLGNNFEFTGSQWGSVTTTYVGIKLLNGKSSDIVLKEINYVD